MDVLFDRGIYLPSLDLWLDSKRKQPIGYISHAHADHTAAHKRPILTPATAILLRKLLRRSEPHTLEYGEVYDAPHYSLTLYPSGHCLGSALALVQCKATGERVLVAHMVGKGLDLEIARDRAPLDHREGGVLIIVEDRATHHRFRPLPLARVGGRDHGRKPRR